MERRPCGKSGLELSVVSLGCWSFGGGDYWGAQDAAGRVLERDEVEQLAVSAGLTPVKTVSKTRCDVLVTAEAGTQSGKARKAAEFGKPVVCADEFFAWVAAHPAAKYHSGS